ncbi:MAG: hypothetical protein RCG15_08400 [Candidatus Rickettsia vulgarisii]
MSKTDESEKDQIQPKIVTGEEEYKNVKKLTYSQNPDVIDYLMKTTEEDFKKN